MFPCPACGKPTRVMHDDRMRICSICRKVSLASQCTVANAPKLKEKASGDGVGSMDSSFGWLDSEAVAPAFPCTNCGKETKSHHEGGQRSCKPCGLIQ